MSNPDLTSSLHVSLTVSGDGMGAKLLISGHENPAWQAAYGTPALLRAFLIHQGMAPEGIRDDVVASIAESLSRTTADSRREDLEKAQSIDVVEGKAPVHEEPIDLFFHKSFLTNAEAIVDVRRRVDTQGVEALRESVDSEIWVESGTPVVSWKGSTPGKDGYDVFGSPIPSLKVLQKIQPFGKSLQPVETRLVAVCEGVLIVEDGLLKVFGGDSLPTCQVVLSEDRMTANLALGGNSINDWSMSLDMVRSALKEQGVVCMIPEAEVQAALNAFNLDRRPRTLLVARGRPPVPGDAGHMDILVDPEPEAPKPGKDGSVDFKEFSFFKTVPKGHRLARMVAPSAGRPGSDVLGNEIPPPPASSKTGPTELGKNTELEAGDSSYVVAAKSGRLAIRGGVPEVVEVLDVDGDVSLKSGNVSFPGAVKVAGDVHGKMEIEAGGDVEVVGTVEDSYIRSNGAIVIRGGANGMGAGLIKSRYSSVTLGYMHNQHIESATHIVVYNEIIGSQLYARKSIVMRSGKYSVLGHILMAGETIELYNVGSENGVKTNLEVGKDFEVEAEMSGLEAKLHADLKDEEFLRAMENELTRVLRLSHKVLDEEARLLKRTVAAMEVLARRIAAGKKAIAALAERLYIPGQCQIILRGTAYPGTILKYRDYRLVLTTQLSNRKWIFREKGPLPPSDGYPA